MVRLSNPRYRCFSFLKISLIMLVEHSDVALTTLSLQIFGADEVQSDQFSEIHDVCAQESDLTPPAYVSKAVEGRTI